MIKGFCLEKVTGFIQNAEYFYERKFSLIISICKIIFLALKNKNLSQNEQPFKSNYLTSSVADLEGMHHLRKRVRE